MKVLIADDDLVNLRLLEAHLTEWGFEVISARDGRTALELLDAPDGPRLALLDWMMPKMDGIDVCERVRAQTDGAYRYLLLVTSKGRKEDMLAGLDAGADDYLTKPLNLAELRARVQTGKRVIELQAALLGAQETLRTQATRDELTGLWNRRAIDEALEHEIPRARRGRSSTAVVLGDLDHFKTINDTYGHAAGDAVLREVAQRIAQAVRLSDSVGRYGGEEFLVMLPVCERAGGEMLAQRICSAVSARPVEFGEIRLSVTISLGLATCPAACCSREQLVERADQALYRAKEAGRDRWESAEHPVPSPAPLETLKDLAEALEELAIR